MIRAALIGSLCAAALTMSGHAIAAPPAAAIQVTDAWIRWLPTDIPAAGYLTLVNTGPVDRVLVAVTSAAYDEVSVHQSQQEHGMSSMRPVDSITLKPQQIVRFTEGGYHLMLMRPRRPIHPGDKVAMTLRFETGPPLEVMFDVRAGG
jgi:copper(I)-binding protein